MIQHYCKIAFRNILKYKNTEYYQYYRFGSRILLALHSQICGYYEITYDKFYEGVERTHLLYQEATFSESTFTHTVHIC